MSTSVGGSVVDENGVGIPGLLVVVRDTSALFAPVLGSATVAGDGAFAVPITADALTDVPGTRQLEVSVQTGTVRRAVFTHVYPDSTGPTTDVGSISLNQRDVQGWAVSLPGTTNALPVRAGNAVRALVDDEFAWGHVAAAMKDATKSISVMQLTLDMPPFYNSVANAEHPETVLAFPATFTTDPPPQKAIDPLTCPRPERLMISAAQDGLDTKVLISSLGNRLLNSLASIAAEFHDNPKGTGTAVEDYFTAASSTARALTFVTQGSSVVHAKVVLVDAVADSVDQSEAMLLGSPFEQSYWDTNGHEVFEARRGGCPGEPVAVHDVSIAVRGPVVADLQEQVRVHWNIADGTASMVPLDPAPTEIATAADEKEFLASVQLVRTVNVHTLPGLDDGELGILEAYLRAIENATDYIYFENQYFTNERIGQALVAALNDATRPDLQLILMVNVIPDMPFYPTWQTNLIARIRRYAPTAVDRIGVFTAWSHAIPPNVRKHTKPVLMPNYLHTKTAVIDGKWATIGSANLDGASLDEFQIARPLIGVNRNDELNCVVFNGVDGCPATGFVDSLRLSLWSEHLGIPVDDDRLQSTTLSSGTGWLKIWTDQAAAKLQALISNPTVADKTNGRVLAYPATAKSGAVLLLPRQHAYPNFLQSAGVDLTKVDVVEHTTKYDFFTGEWADK